MKSSRKFIVALVVSTTLAVGVGIGWAWRFRAVVE
jgi:hypothetical protein